MPTLSQAGKDEARATASAALCTAQQQKGCGTASTASPQGSSPGPSSPSHQFAQIY